MYVCPVPRSKIFGLRLSADEERLLSRLVERANARAEDAALPATITASSYIRLLLQRAAAELDQSEPTLQERPAPNVAAARAKLREGRAR